jgi:hypothetical protein
MNPGSTYSTRPAVLPAERERVLAVWEGTLGEHSRMSAKFGWFYEQSPTGMPLAQLLEWRAAADSGAQVIGVATAGRRQFRCGSQEMPAGVLVDMAVRPEHRTLGPALQLQKALLAESLRSVDFVYGFPNPKAAPVFQRAGYQRLGKMQRHVRVLRASGYLGRRLPATVARLLAPFADFALRVRIELQAMLARAPRLEWGSVEDLGRCPAAFVPRGNSLCGARSAEFLAWRFSKTHSANAHFSVLARLPAGDAHWVVEDQGKVLQVRDCSSLLLDAASAGAWRALFRDAARRGIHSVSFECLAAASQLDVLKSLGMVVRSDRPVFWSGFRPTQQAVAAEFFLTSADEDE